MIAACKKAKVHLGIGYRLHYEPHIREVMRLSKEKAFGEWKTLFAEFGFRIGDPTQWRLKQALAGGGPLMDLGVYCLQGICQLTDQLPVAITAQQVKTDPVKFAEVVVKFTAFVLEVSPGWITAFEPPTAPVSVKLPLNDQRWARSATAGE